MNKKPWYRQLSTWTGLGAIIGGVGGLVTGTVDAKTSIEAIWGGFALIFVRRAIENTK